MPGIDEMVWYGENGERITMDEALDLMRDHKRRTLESITLEFMGHELSVVTVFLPIDSDPTTHGTYTDRPALWVTEILGGPPDLDGTHHLSHSRAEALEFHDQVVGRAVASGCKPIRE